MPRLVYLLLLCFLFISSGPFLTLDYCSLLTLSAAFGSTAEERLHQKESRLESLQARVEKRQAIVEKRIASATSAATKLAAAQQSDRKALALSAKHRRKEYAEFAKFEADRSNPEFIAQTAKRLKTLESRAAKSKDGIIIARDLDDFDRFVTAGPRAYHLIVELTALDANVQCPVCRVLHKSMVQLFPAIASAQSKLFNSSQLYSYEDIELMDSLPGSTDEHFPLFALSFDYTASVSLFNSLGLTYAPIVMFIPAETSSSHQSKASPAYLTQAWKYQSVGGDQQIEPMLEWIGKQLDRARSSALGPIITNHAPQPLPPAQLDWSSHVRSALGTSAPSMNEDALVQLRHALNSAIGQFLLFVRNMSTATFYASFLAVAVVVASIVPTLTSTVLGAFLSRTLLRSGNIRRLQLLHDLRQLDTLDAPSLDELQPPHRNPKDIEPTVHQCIQALSRSISCILITPAASDPSSDSLSVARSITFMYLKSQRLHRLWFAALSITLVTLLPCGLMYAHVKKDNWGFDTGNRGLIAFTHSVTFSVAMILALLLVWSPSVLPSSSPKPLRAAVWLIEASLIAVLCCIAFVVLHQLRQYYMHNGGAYDDDLHWTMSVFLARFRSWGRTPQIKAAIKFIWASLGSVLPKFLLK